MSRKDDCNTKCPCCNEKNSVGFLGGCSCKKYYCSSCGVEFTVKKGNVVETHRISANGTLDEKE
jgi:transposase-like protein